MFDWIQDLINGVGDAISSALATVWETIAGSIWGTFMEWIYTTVYNALAEFFSMMAGIGAQLFDLQWVQSALRFFSLFGWGLFITGLIVAIFDIAIEYQTMGRLNVKRQVLPFIWGLLALITHEKENGNNEENNYPIHQLVDSRPFRRGTVGKEDLSYHSSRYSIKKN